MANGAPRSRGFVNVKLIHDPKDAEGTSRCCADIFLVGGPGPDIESIWTDHESGTFWPRDILPKDAELQDACRVWNLKMCDVDPEKDPELRSFQDCILLQNYSAGFMNAVDQRVSSDPAPAPAGGGGGGDDDEAPDSDRRRPNNGSIVVVGHGLGGLLALCTPALLFLLSSQLLHGHHLGLKKKDWRVVLLGTPTLYRKGNIMDDCGAVSSLVSYYGGKSYSDCGGEGCSQVQTRAFWTGLEQQCLCLVNGDWADHDLAAPAEPYGTLKVASFEEGVEDESLARARKELQPSNPHSNGLVVQKCYSLFGGKAQYGFSMADPPSSVMPCMHKNMGQFKDQTDPRYLALRAVLKEFVKPE